MASTDKERHSEAGLVQHHPGLLVETVSVDDAGAVFRNVDDDRLRIAVARGEEDALAELYERHGPAVFGFVLTRAGADRARYVTRGVFLTLWHAPQIFVVVRGSLRPSLLEEALGWVIDRPRTVTLRLASEVTTSDIDLEQQLRGPWANKTTEGVWRERTDGIIRGDRKRGPRRLL
jgi:hypothetical protein